MNVYYNNPLCIDKLPFELIWEIYKYLPPHPLKTIYDKNITDKINKLLEKADRIAQCPLSIFFIYKRLMNSKEILTLREQIYNDTPIKRRGKLNFIEIHPYIHALDNCITMTQNQNPDFYLIWDRIDC